MQFSTLYNEFPPLFKDVIVHHPHIDMSTLLSYPDSHFTEGNILLPVWRLYTIRSILFSVFRKISRSILYTEIALLDL